MPPHHVILRLAGLGKAACSVSGGRAPNLPTLFLHSSYEYAGMERAVVLWWSSGEGFYSGMDPTRAWREQWSTGEGSYSGMESWSK